MAATSFKDFYDSIIDKDGGIKTQVNVTISTADFVKLGVIIVGSIWIGALGTYGIKRILAK